MDLLRFELPYPPSINHYYAHASNRVILGAKGKSYRRDVALLLHLHRGHCGDKRLAITINVFPPDKRKRDLDNILKSTIDALQHAAIFDDDNQIDMLTVIRRDVIKGGSLAIWINECC